LLLSIAPPEEGRRMTKGSGRSDCFRVGVTYGHMECLRKGRVRYKLRRKFAGPKWLDGLAESFNVQNVDLEHCVEFPLLHIPRKTVSRCFLMTVYRETSSFWHKQFHCET